MNELTRYKVTHAYRAESTCDTNSTANIREEYRQNAGASTEGSRTDNVAILINIGKNLQFLRNLKCSIKHVIQSVLEREIVSRAADQDNQYNGDIRYGHGVIMFK